MGVIFSPARAAALMAGSSRGDSGRVGGGGGVWCLVVGTVVVVIVVGGDVDVNAGSVWAEGCCRSRDADRL